MERDFQVLKLVGVPQPKPMHRFSTKFQDMYDIPRGSRADYVWGGIQRQLLPWQQFKNFWILNFVPKSLIFSVT